LKTSEFNVNAKQSTNPLRLIKTINVSVSGLTESSGTSIWTTLLGKYYHHFPILYPLLDTSKDFS